MDFPITLLKLAGSVALLLWGVHMVQSGVQHAFGAKLRSFLSHAGELLVSRIRQDDEEGQTLMTSRDPLHPGPRDWYGEAQD